MHELYNGCFIKRAIPYQKRDSPLCVKGLTGVPLCQIGNRTTMVQEFPLPITHLLGHLVVSKIIFSSNKSLIYSRHHLFVSRKSTQTITTKTQTIIFHSSLMGYSQTSMSCYIFHLIISIRSIILSITINWPQYQSSGSK